MGSDVKRIALSGYYGFNNSGDEAVLQSILLALKEQGTQQGITFEPVVLSINPELTRQMYGVEAVHRMKPMEVLRALRSVDGLISGGGSLLQDVTSGKTIPYYTAVLKLAQWLGKPTFVYSQGVGPVRRKSFFPLIRSAFRNSKYISVRDKESADLLRKIGLPEACIDVVPDPVMGLPLRAEEVSAQKGTEQVIGVSVRYWNEDRSELDNLALALRDIMAGEQQVRVRLLPFHLPSDEEASRYVADRVGADYAGRIETAQGITHPQDMLAEAGRCSLLIGMRLHSLIYAASQYVPMLGISYDPKIDQFLRRLDMSASATAANLSSDKLAGEAHELLHHPQQWIDSKKQLIDGLKSQAQEPARQIAVYFRNKG